MTEFAYLHIASLLFALFFVLLLLSKKGKGVGDYILVVFLLLLSTNYATMFVVLRELEGFRWLIEISDASVFIYGPLLWWYTLAFTELNFKLRAEYLGHAFPFLMALVLLMVPVLRGGEIEDALRHSLLGLKMLSMLVYCLLILRVLARYQGRLEQYFSTTDRLQLRWIYFLCLSILLVWGVAVVSLFLFFFTDIEIPQHGGLYSNVAVSVYIFVMGIYGFRQTTVFTPVYLFREVMLIEPGEEILETKPDSKYKNSGLQESEARRNMEKLLAFMKTERPYLDQDLTLFKLAEGIDISPNHLSQTINSLRQQNFFDFINQYRVEAVKKLLQGPEAERMTLLGLGMEAGFKSKASFNRAFKKFTGMTPSEYKMEIDSANTVA